jgi:DNA polymerase-3 subunit alpha
MVVQLHNHSHYSILDGRSRISEIIDRVRELGQKSVALTDHGVMHGAIEFYRAANTAGIKPIIGVEAYVARESMFRKDPALDRAGSSNHLTLLATSEVGYKNLLKLTSKAHVEGFYYKPRIDFPRIVEHSAGIFALSGCMSGLLSDTILAGDRQKARRIAAEYRDVFGERYAIEVHNHGHEKQATLNPVLFEIADELGIRTVAACDSHYARPEDARSHDAMLAIQTGSTLDDPSRFKITPYGAYYLRSEAEMLRDFSGREEAVRNTEWVAEQCNLKLDFSKVMLPQFEVPAGHTPISWLRQQVDDGLRWRYGSISPAHQERVNYELSVIEQTGYALYFLIVQDYVRFARLQGVMAVPRGSVAGSLCVYVLGICDIDPVKYDIMFERFLHGERKGMPDIDMDFADDRRDDVIKYVTEKYGANRVAHVGTFQTLGARAAVKDAARVMSIDFSTSNAFTALFPDKGDVQLANMERDPRIKQFLRDNSELADVFVLAKELEGLTRGFGTHAAGLLITETDLVDVVPIQLPPEKSSKKFTGTFVTQYDNNNETGIIESLGLSKFDFLGLANLSIIKEACQLIRKRHGVDLYGESGEKLYNELPTDIEIPSASRTYEMLSAGHTTAVFQVESPGMRGVLRQVQPNRITDLPAIVALYRPGPMEYIPVFAMAKNGNRKTTYLHEDLRPILEETYGVVTYQDQVLLIARKIAGFTWGEVDVLRKGMGKKMLSVIEEQRQKFVSKSIERGYDPETVDQIWEQIAPFAGYGFNRAHAFCYGYVSYITAFLKANYSIEYLTAVLTHEAGNKDKVSEAVAECKRMGIPVLSPSVNISREGFSIAEVDGVDTIVFGLNAVSGVGASACRNIVFTRLEKGIFHSFYAFLSNCDLGSMNQRTIGNLIHAGAFDEFGERFQLITAMGEQISAVKSLSQRRGIGQMELFEANDLVSMPDLPSVLPYTKKQRLDAEMESLGMYLSEHPLDEIRSFLEEHCTHTAGDIANCPDEECVIGGTVTSVRYHRQKNGKQMAFLVIEDYVDKVDVVIFARLFEKVQDFAITETNVLVKGTIRERNGKYSVIADDFAAIDMKIASIQRVNEPNYPVREWNLSLESVPSRIFRLWTTFQDRKSPCDPEILRILSSTGQIDVQI